METTHRSADARAVAVEIMRAMRELRTGRITADAYRSTMDTLRSRMTEGEWDTVKFLAAANDR